ncbi:MULTISPECIES: transcriptional regulator [unclassified Streptomyces]|uniref:transcriptional regulator n=1 Tax=unclassified Streptomyces TaxID=2593676 RepID=UPI00278BD596|nr:MULTISPECIES: transcriptional regulator [unclassified Streptomyces]
MSVPDGFDELIHPATRLSVVSLLAATEWAEFSFVRDSLSLSDSALSKQLHTLEEAGYLELRKEGGGRKRRTRVRLTDRGRTAFEGHVAALRAIVESAGSAAPAAPAVPAVTEAKP